MADEVDPSEFVQRIRQLGEQRDQQDAERVRRLEEQLMQGRSERLARRAERARSISPEKSTPPRAATATPPAAAAKTPAGSPAPTMKPADETAREKPAEAPPSPQKTSAAALGRSGTLSWKQRPQSTSARRPLSAMSFDKPAVTSPRDTPEPASPESGPPSRSSIAASLSAKDPAWFRQTPDRGASSAAYRRPADDDTASEAGSVTSRRQLPGMSRETTVEPEVGSPPASVVTARSPLPVLEAHRLPPPSEAGFTDGGDAAVAARGLAMSPTQGRISPERPASPTKGMGGFVQSAMLKRSDSVNKRWSAQPQQGLSRQNSTISNRGSAMAGYGSLSKMERPSTLGRENSAEQSSRPTSSQGNAAASSFASDLEKINAPKDEFVKPALPHHSRSKSVASTFSERDQPQDDAPPSPSKRWSPTKSSWLESALNRPDSPKPKQPPPAQPAWMAELNRAKQQRGSVDLGKGTPFASSPADVFGSGRVSPTKDFQLKSAGRRDESPRKEEKLELPNSPDVPMAFKSEVTSPDPQVHSDTEPMKKEENLRSPTPPLSTPGLAKSTSLQSVKDAPKVTPTVKPKPDAILKTDFRAGLKSRQLPSDASKNKEVSELQNVFGKLRKAETKNYIAPDTLKDNILRGKSALNVTGGPKPSVRRDEFKESLIKKKSAMLLKAQEEGSALKRSDSTVDANTTPPPEAIAKRGGLNRAERPAKPESLRQEPDKTTEALSRKKSLRSVQHVKEKASEQPAPLVASKEPSKSNKFADRFNPALAGLLARGPPSTPTNKSSPSTNGTDSMSMPVQEDKAGPTQDLQHMTKGRARGPKRRAPGAKQVATEPEKCTSPTQADVDTLLPVKPEHVLPSPEPFKTNRTSEELPVTRTPARQSLAAKPATPAKSPRISSGQSYKSTPEPPKNFTSTEPGDSVAAARETSRKTPLPEVKIAQKPASPIVPKKPSSMELDRRVSASINAPQKSPLVEAKELVTSFSTKVSSKPSSQQSASIPSHTLSSLPAKSPEPAQPRDFGQIGAPGGEVTPVKEGDIAPKQLFASVRSASALWGRQPSSSIQTGPKSPIRLPTKADEQAAMQEAGLVTSPPMEKSPMKDLTSPISSPAPSPRPLLPKPKPTGLGFSLGSISSFVTSRSRESSPQPPTNFPSSPPASGNRPQSEPFKPPPAQKHDGLFAEFFDEQPSTEDLPFNIDTLQILNNTPDLGSATKIRTLRKQIYELMGDGKLLPIPIQEEHILSQDCMYLCTHIYSDHKGAKRTDVYLWAGNDIAEPTLEDAQLFAKNHARQNQGQLIIIRQGKEPPNFFDALGGIVITRRSTKAPSKDYMLCGRSHLGHLSFDEVDFSPKSLCSAFPFLISTSSGVVYLWKGRGCTVEELSGARLTGMDMAPSGLTEIDDGTEPAHFTTIFPPASLPAKGPAIPRSADHWRYKPTLSAYRARLFRIEQVAPQGWGHALQVSSSFFAPLLRRPSWNAYTESKIQTPLSPKSPRSPSISAGSGGAGAGGNVSVTEIQPFCQRDLEPEGVYVLDAFFEMYIILGPLTRTAHHAFATALLFAQHYSLLAASEQNRPLIPVGTVVLEGVPRDMKVCFRGWDEGRLDAAALMRGKLGRGKSLRVVGLEKAVRETGGK